MKLKNIIKTFLLLLAMSLAATPSMAQQSAEKKEEIRQYMLKYMEQENLMDDVDGLKYGSEDIPETDMSLVYLEGRDWCGSGRCRMFILRKNQDTFDLVNEISISWPPIIALKTKQNGAPDIAVMVSGGGADPGMVALPFDGKEYPLNPTMPPARKVTDISGTVLIKDLETLVPLIK